MRALLAAAAAVALWAAPVQAAPDNLVPNGEFDACTDGWQTWSGHGQDVVAGCSAGHEDPAGVQVGVDMPEPHGFGSAGVTRCVETPGLAAGPRVFSYAYLPHAEIVNVGTGNGGTALSWTAYDAPGCAGTAIDSGSVPGAAPGADQWFTAESAEDLVAGVQSIRVLVFGGCPGGNTCLKDSTFYRFDDVVVAGDGEIVEDCADPGLAEREVVAGDLVIGPDADCALVDLPGLVSVGGDLSITGTPATGVHLPGLAEVGGDLDVTGNPSVGVILVGDVAVGGDLDISGNGPAVGVSIGDAATVGGDLHLEGTGGLAASTPGGSTQLALLGGTAVLSLGLPDGTFSEAVPFTIDPAGELAFAIGFAAPLGLAADLRLVVDPARLDAATREALLAAVGEGRATLAVRPDGADKGVPRPVCAPGDDLAGGCVEVTTLGGGLLQFRAAPTTFSTWSVAIVPAPPPPAGDGPAGLPAGRLAFGRLVRDRRTGAARLALEVPGAGRLVLRGRRLRTVRREVAAGVTRVTVPVRARGRARRSLLRRGRVRLRVRATHSAAPEPIARRVTLRRARGSR